MKKNTVKICVASKPDMLEEWNFEKNDGVNPNKLGFGSAKVVWWKCKVCGHEWESSPVRRSQGYHNCVGCGSLGRKNPELAKEWNFNKNSPLTPFDVYNGSGKNAWWIHEINGEKHEWEADIKSRNKGNGCPYCSGHKVCKSNCLATKRPEIAKEWHPTKNGDLTSTDVGAGSQIKAWWQCKKCKTEWKTEVYHRNDGNGCPRCSQNHKVRLIDGENCDSKTEAFCYLWLKSSGLSFVHDGKYGGLGKKGNSRYDFYVPIQNIYLEVTGYDNNMKNGRWFHYLRKIVKKRKYVEDVLKANFVFITHVLSKEEKAIVKQNTKKT